MSYFIIIAPGRSASTSMRLTINAAPTAVCHGEILGKDRVLGLSKRKLQPGYGGDLSVARRSADPSGFCKDVLEDLPYGQIGFKALYTHFFDGVCDPVMDQFLAHKPRVVFLWRRNLVKRFLSQCRKRMLENNSRPDRFARVSEADIIADAQHHMEMARKIRARLADHDINDIMDVDFEDMAAGPKVLHDVMTFLALSDSGYEIRTDNRTMRNKNDRAQVNNPSCFSSAAVQPYTDVSLKQVLQG